MHQDLEVFTPPVESTLNACLPGSVMSHPPSPLVISLFHPLPFLFLLTDVQIQKAHEFKIFG